MHPALAPRPGPLTRVRACVPGGAGRRGRGRTLDGRAARATALAVVAGVLLVGCASEAPTSPAPSPSETVPSTPSATPEPEYGPEDEAAVRAVWDSYWAAAVASLNGPDPDPRLWSDFASEEVVAERTTLAESYVEADIVFTGAPEVEEPTVEWAEGSALLVACVDESGWVGTQDGEALPPRPYDVHPFALTVLEQDDGWVVAKGDEKPSGVTC